MRRMWWCFFLALVARPATADDQLHGLGVTTWAYTQTITTTDACVARAGGSSACILIPAGDSAEHRFRATIVQSSGAARVCLVSDPALTIQDDLELTEGAASTRGSCHEFPSGGGIWQIVADRRALIDAGVGGLAKTGICSVGVSTTHGERNEIYAPCSVNGDCNAYGAGSCISAGSVTTRQVQGAALFLIARAVTGSVTLTVRKERVPR
jgi:hypothetical protein